MWYKNPVQCHRVLLAFYKWTVESLIQGGHCRGKHFPRASVLCAGIHFNGGWMQWDWFFSSESNENNCNMVSIEAGWLQPTQSGTLQNKIFMKGTQIEWMKSEKKNTGKIPKDVTDQTITSWILNQFPPGNPEAGTRHRTLLWKGDVPGAFQSRNLGAESVLQPVSRSRWHPAGS